MEYKEDLRIVRTRKLLSTTLLDIMEETSIEKISVIDLCNRAMVNRATFYAHFEDKYHLLTFALEELKDDIYAKFTKETKADTPGELCKDVLIMVIDFMSNEQNHVTNVIKNNRNEKVINTIENSIARSIKYQLSKFKNQYEFLIPLNLISAFLAGGMMSFALWYIDNPDKMTKNELISYAENFTRDNIYTKKY